MVLWNRLHGRRGGEIFFAIALICMSIFPLFVLVGLPAWLMPQKVRNGTEAARLASSDHGQAKTTSMIKLKSASSSCGLPSTNVPQNPLKLSGAITSEIGTPAAMPTNSVVRLAAKPLPDVTLTPMPTPSPILTVTPTVLAPSATVVPTPAVTPTPDVTPTMTVTPSVTATVTATPVIHVTPTSTSVVTPTPTIGGSSSSTNSDNSGVQPYAGLDGTSSSSLTNKHLSSAKRDTCSDNSIAMNSVSSAPKLTVNVRAEANIALILGCVLLVVALCCCVGYVMKQK